jgi:signal transduction histidine kinase
MFMGGSMGQAVGSAFVAAAQRALDESREAISALSRRVDQTLDDAVAEAAEEITNRIGIPLQLDLAKSVAVPAPLREELVRIVREAVANAARHANARLITVVLARDSTRLRLQVIDDGHGFDPANVRYGRAGLSTMHQRARDIGAELSIATEVGTGTVIELDLSTGGPS